jgi:hypothetical protein
MTRAKPKLIGLVGAVVVIGTMLSGCSDIYYDRRDTLALASGDAVKGNVIVQTVDPWPAASSNRNHSTNGDRMQRAVERYRTNKTTPLTTTSTSSVPYQAPAASAAPATGGASGGGGTP